MDPCGLAEGCVFMLFPGCVFEGGSGKMSCRRRGGRWNEDDLVESSASDLLRNVSCKHLFFCQGCFYSYINMLKAMPGRILF